MKSSQYVDVLKKICELGNPVTILRSLYQRRYLLKQMVQRDLGQRYKGSFLGIIWAVINPLFMLLIYTFVFSVIFKARWRPTDEVVPMGEFALTLFAGLIPFNLFSESVNRSTGVIHTVPNFVKKVIFPLEIMPLVVTGTSFANSLISLGILLAASLIVFGKIQATAIFIPLVYAPLILLVMGLGWFLASLGVYLRDIGQIVSLVTQILFFLTPIFYPPTVVPERFQFVMKLNPLSMIVTNFRNLLIWGELFPVKEWILWVVITGGLAVLGYIWFMATKKGFADVL